LREGTRTEADRAQGKSVGSARDQERRGKIGCCHATIRGGCLKGKVRRENQPLKIYEDDKGGQFREKLSRSAGIALRGKLLRHGEGGGATLITPQKRKRVLDPGEQRKTARTDDKRFTCSRESNGRRGRTDLISRKRGGGFVVRVVQTSGLIRGRRPGGEPQGRDLGEVVLSVGKSLREKLG